MMGTPSSESTPIFYRFLYPMEVISQSSLQFLHSMKQGFVAIFPARSGVSKRTACLESTSWTLLFSYTSDVLMCHNSYIELCFKHLCTISLQYPPYCLMLNYHFINLGDEGLGGLCIWSQDQGIHWQRRAPADDLSSCK